MSDLLTTARKRMLILDGAMGTELMARGLEAGESPELWNVEHPGRISDVHRAYLDAGADVILTNTFGASRFKLEKSNLVGRVVELNEAAAALARQAAGPDRFVLGDVGPTGELMSPLGIHAEDEFVEVFKEQIEALAVGGIDGILIETQTALEEVIAAAKAAKAVTDLPVLVSMQFRRDADGIGLHTMMGIDVPTMIEKLTPLGVDVLGANCATPEELISVAEIIKDRSDLPILIEPNAGLPELIAGQTVFKLGPEEFLEQVKPLIDAGVNLIGGCCGTTPEHVRALAEYIRANDE